LLAAVCILANTASAQSGATPCASIKENAKRLACYDKAHETAQKLLPPAPVITKPRAPLELKGVDTSSQMEQINALYPDFDKNCSTDPATQTRGCLHLIPDAKDLLKGGRYTLERFHRYPDLQQFGGVPVKYFSVIFGPNPTPQAVSVTVSTTHWRIVKDALIEKYGPPQSATDSTIQNRAGASFDQEVLLWTDGDKLLQASKRGRSVEDASVTLTSKVAAEAAADAAKKAAKENAKAL
jgi:hypothetical protein